MATQALLKWFEINKTKANPDKYLPFVNTSKPNMKNYYNF